ncbi:hypothetical protein A1Q1_02414 [Trichosporon asahii var. asahii CBS 2479]|uniref:Cytochrome c oxidase assembly factor 5 n=1 Tax=Trichosporon asahii var. asahii (strain ATCC 90039 / CBS 2479 / JCM 2466 / KCTC 7840 / NBRC 103889/ NCYC 2677 / UAMH 7654) TaxID=1186058 RepID=J4UC86_TRIAS|nr:hypothetical protein A1Q1_02414 [Trichosporon asahii var. asahii CBS 2479]EJT48565.1 hypothetical protein A1Q1_02414 [Trichosporon asahii var. asahii CBS 2479]
MAAENKKTSGPPLACAKDREDLIQCVLRTDCEANLSVMKKGKTPGDCIRSNDLPLPCQHLLANYADCKRGMGGEPQARLQ